MLRSLASLGLVLAVAVGCGDVRADAEAREAGPVVDDAGREVRIAHVPDRVISLVPSATDLLVAMGAEHLLVARTADDEAPELSHLPSVGRGLTPNLEAVAALRPDLVITWPDELSRSIVARLAALDVPAYAAESQTLADVTRTARRLGKLLGMDAAADSLAATLEAQLAAVRRAVAGRERPRVFYAIWTDPPMTTGPGTFIHELIHVAGGQNIFGDARGLWPQVSLEEVVYRRPDVIILPRTEDQPVDLERLRDAPGWQELEAVRSGRVFVVDAGVFNRPGARVGEAARRLAALLHPAVSLAERTP